MMQQFQCHRNTTKHSTCGHTHTHTHIYTYIYIYILVTEYCLELPYMYSCEFTVSHERTHSRITKYFEPFSMGLTLDVPLLSLQYIPLTHTHTHTPHTHPPPADTAVFFCLRECDRGSPLSLKWKFTGSEWTVEKPSP